MATRSERYLYEQDETKSRVARNQKLYDSIYDEESYFQEVEKPSVIEKTNEIDIDKVKELLKGREVYRRELKMRELNMLNSDGETPVQKEEDEEEKSYDINAYLDKATSERNVDSYHRINPEILKSLEIEDSMRMRSSDISRLTITAVSKSISGLPFLSHFTELSARETAQPSPCV